MNVKMLGAVLLCAVLLLSGAACGGEGSIAPPPEGVLAVQVRDSTIAAEAELDTCQFDMTMDMIVTGGQTPGTITTDATGAIDEPSEEMYMNMYISMEVSELGDMEAWMGWYFVEGWMYMGMEMYGEEMWLKTLMTEELWEEQDIVSQQLDILLDSEVELVGTQTVGGTECYVLDVAPDLAKLWDWAQMQEWMEEDTGFDPEDVISEFSVRQWIATDTYFPVKAVIEMTMTIESQTIDMTMTMLMYDFNEPVSIVLPPEAEDAVEVESFD